MTLFAIGDLPFFKAATQAVLILELTTTLLFFI